MKLFSRIIFLATGICISAGVAQSQVYDAIVAGDGSGDYQSVQMAIEDVPANSSERTLIFIRNGEYHEKLWIYESRNNVSVIGESREGVVIAWNDYSGKTAGMNTADSYTLLAEGDDLYMENITVKNTAGNVGQAVAIRTTGDRQVFKNCSFTGFQDTFYAHKNRQYLLNCHVEGATDFIFGDATAVFDNCTIHCVEGGQFITAPADTKLISTTSSDEKFYHGLLFKNCGVTAGDKVPGQSYYLGRPWQPAASSVFINCTLAEHIKDEGWSVWSDDNHLSGVFAEYHSRDTDGELIDTSQRVEWSRQLAEEEVNDYYNLNYFLKKEEVEWDPRSTTESLPAPENLDADGYELTWESADQAIGYAIIRNGKTIDFSTDAYYEDGSANPARENVYEVRSVTAWGGLSPASEKITVEATLTDVHSPTREMEIYYGENKLFLSEKAGIELFDLSGRLIGRAANAACLPLPQVRAGLYVLKLTERNGDVWVKKIALVWQFLKR